MSTDHPSPTERAPLPMDDTPNDDTYVRTLVARLRADPRVVGLVLAGSSADTGRRDRWSDHDFLVITDDGTPEEYRTDLAWLPDAADIAFSFRDTAHGLKALYRTGLMIEFAVFDRAEFAACALNHYRVALDTGGITELAAAVQERSLGPRPPLDRRAALGSFLCLAYIGTGRARRGERLSANVFIRDHATAHLLRLVTDLLDPAVTDRLDALDPWRRFETAAPRFAAEVDAALSAPVDEAGVRLVEVADRHLRSAWPDYPAADAALVLELLAQQ